LNAGTSVVSEVSETIAWDTRDTRVNTTKGLLVRNTQAVAGLIGTEQYYRTTADAVYYQSIFEDVVASIGGSIGAVIPYNGSSLRLNNLFFIGGDTMRGFQVGGIGPRDSITTDALGGTYFYTGTSELSFPLGLPKEIGILGKAFVDVGSLWGLGGPAQYSNTVLTSNTMRVSTGLGIQWISPFGPIRIDYAFPLVADPWDKTENFRFGFGTRF
jgi:outer membrane protein insertion porin family